MKYIETQAKSAIYALKKKALPYKYDLNIYRGCAHGCKYCYAPKSHKYVTDKKFDEEIFVKTNIVELLEKDLSNPGYQKDIINIGGVCDSYQVGEEQYRLMPDVLKVLIKYKNPVIISTKSDLILRDIDLIDQLASHVYVNIAVSLTLNDAGTAKKVEPEAVSPERRFRVLKEMGKTRAYTGFHAMPILPYLGDSDETLEQLVAWASEAEVSYMLSGILYLTKHIRPNYMGMLLTQYPHLVEVYDFLYQKGSAEKEYKSRIHNYLKQMRKKYNVNNSYAKFLPKKEKRNEVPKVR